MVAASLAVAPGRSIAEDRPFESESELRAALKRLHAIVYTQYARDPAATFDITCLILAAKLTAEAGHAPWPSATESSAAKTEKLGKAFEEADRWLSGWQELASVPIKPTGHFADAVVSLLSGYSLRLTVDELGADVLGTAYQAIVGATFRGELGAYFTPPSIAEFMVAMVDLKSGLVADPASGTGTLLLAAEQHGRAVVGHGNDINPRMVRAARLNYALQGKPVDRVIGGDGLEVARMLSQWPLPVPRAVDGAAGDWLSSKAGVFDAIFANPPFAGHERNPENLAAIRSARTAAGRITGLPRTLPFLEVILAMLKEGGVGAVVIPTSVLNAEAEAFRRFRQVLLENAEIMALVGLPEAAFAYTDCGIHGALLFFRRVQEPRLDYPIFVDWLDNVGYDRMGREIGDADFDAVVDRYHGEWREGNAYQLSDLIRSDRFDPNWLRHAPRGAAQEGLVPLTRHFVVRSDRLRMSDLADEKEYSCFEVADADMTTGEVGRLRTLSGAEVKAKSRLRVQLQEGDILLPNHRDSLIARGAPTGRSAVVVTKEMSGAITSNRFVVLESDLPAPVARAILNSAGVRRQLVSLCRGAASLDIREKSLDAVLVPPELVSQDKVAALQHQAEAVDRLRAEWKAQSAALRQAVEATFADESDFRPLSRQVM